MTWGLPLVTNGVVHAITVKISGPDGFSKTERLPAGNRGYTATGLDPLMSYQIDIASVNQPNTDGNGGGEGVPHQETVETLPEGKFNSKLCVCGSENNTPGII